MNNSNGKIEQGVMTMDYVRFIGGSFGTAIATNSLVYFQNKEFDSMVILQNKELVAQTLEKIPNVLFLKLQQFFSFDYGFKYVWLDAAFWGFLGSVFVFMLLFFKRRENV